MSHAPLVAVAMSGGVDSSVAAAFLLEQGYDVIGVMLRLWSEPGDERFNRCCTPDSISLARRVASILSIPFYVLDARQLFYDSVVVPFIDSYTHNRTPNPCIYCNRKVRWGFLLEYALAAGAEFLATGHYARLARNETGLYQLSRGIDLAKDQSYVLHTLSQEQLSHALFPLGGYTKQQVRQRAESFNLPVATRPDSQDLCFIGSQSDYRSFLRSHAPQSLIPGMIKDRSGKVLGEHPGLAFFTIGQRKGIKVASSQALYVLEKDAVTNTLVVGTPHQASSDYLLAEHVNWIDGHPPPNPFRAQVKIRYRSPELPGMIYPEEESRIRIQFDQFTRDITPGQAAVLYNDAICLGGGIISSQV